jgi:hypothetical protein
MPPNAIRAAGDFTAAIVACQPRPISPIINFMPRRFQFSLRELLVLILVVACFFAGVRFERERRRRESGRNGTWLDVDGIEMALDADGDLDVLVLGPRPGSQSSLKMMLWGIALVGAFVGGMALERRLARARQQPVQPPGSPKMPANAPPRLPDAEPN